MEAWPDQWSYHMQLVRVLEKLGRNQEALLALDGAAGHASNDKQIRETAQTRARLERHPDD